jgi:hypothetical protein
MQVAASLGYKEPTKNETYEPFSVSKVWPYDKSRTIVALCYPSKIDPDEGAMYDLDVLVVDSKTLTVIARSKKKDAISSDAVYLSGLSIDTAPYNLAKGVRAFGVRKSFSGSSRVYPYEETFIDLYVPQGNGLMTVLDSMSINLENGKMDDDCGGTFINKKRTISIGKTDTKGYRDLIVDGVMLTQVDKTDKNGKCKHEEIKGKPEKFILKYDGNVYSIPKTLRFVR